MMKKYILMMIPLKRVNKRFMAKRLSSLFLTVTMSVMASMTAVAKTAKWSVEPQYQSIEMMSPGTFLVKRGAYSSIIDGNGKEIVSATTDSITPFTEGQALVLTPAGEGRYRLQGILHEDFTSTPVNDEVYVNEYPFFSEGLLPVCNNQGFYGYMDPTGRMVLTPRYTNPHPFSEGYAAVTERMKGLLGNLLSKGLDKIQEIAKQKAATIYINRAGVALKVDKEVGKVANGTTFSNGTAYVENKKGDCYVIDLKGRVVSRGMVSEFDVDDHYRLISNEASEGLAKNSAIPAVSSSPDDVVSFTENNLTGYRTKAGTTVLPPQFKDAEDFVDGFALAMYDSKWGILKLEDGIFSGKEQAASAPASKRKGKKSRGGAKVAQPSKYVITTPEVWDDISLTLTLNAAGEHKSETLEGNGSKERFFAMEIPKSNGVLKLHTANLLLWEHDLSAPTEETVKAPVKSRLKISISPASAKADIRDNAAITVTLTNPGDEDVTTIVSMNGTGLKAVNRTVTIPAHNKIRVNTVFTNVVEKEFRTVNVSAGGRYATKTITVNPFYVKF